MMRHQRIFWSGIALGSIVLLIGANVLLHDSGTGESNMRENQEVILSPTTPLAPQEIAVTFDLYSEEQPLGGSDSPMKVKEGTIELGRPQIQFLPVSKKSADTNTIVPDRKNWDLYRIIQPFSLHMLPSGRYYQSLMFSLNLANSDTTALDLFPRQVIKEEVNITITLGPNFKFKEVEVKAGELLYQVTFERLRPQITVTGIGRHQFYWTYTSQDSIGIIPESKYALIILQVPRHTHAVSGQVYYKADIVKPWLNIFKTTEAKSDYIPVHWELPRSIIP